MPDAGPITAELIDAAREAGVGVVKHTPVLTSRTISRRVGGEVLLKAENLQSTGSFKIRGALSKLRSLGAGVERGVVAGSAGNHAQAVALAARHYGVPCEIFVPEGASITKTEATRAYGATVVQIGESVDVALAAAEERAAEAGMALIHPFDDAAIIAGQATVGLELAEDVPNLTRVVVPVGGGGLVSGVAIALRRANPAVSVVGVQVEVCAPFTRVPVPHDRIPGGPIITLADGIAVKRPGRLTRPLVDAWVDEIVTVGEDDVADAMMLLMERTKLFVEGGGAVGVAALMTGRVAPAASGATVAILSGGNVDLGVLPNLIRRAETRAGRRLLLFVRITDRPGGLARLLSVISEQGANVIEIEHVREGVDLHVRETGVQVAMEVRTREHADAVVRAVQAAGYTVQVPLQR